MKETRIIIKDFGAKVPGYRYRICDYDCTNYLIELRAHPTGFDTAIHRETDETNMDADPETTDKLLWRKLDGININLAVGMVVDKLIEDN